MADYSGLQNLFFGGPVGQITGELLDRDSARLMSEMALNKATTRLRTSDADLREEEARQAKIMQEVAGQLVQIAGPGGMASPNIVPSLEDAYAKYEGLLFQAGAPDAALKVRKTREEINANRNLADLRNERKLGEQQRQEFELLDRAGSYSQTVLSSPNQQTWDQVRMVDASTSLPLLQNLPQKVEEALPILSALAGQSIQAKDQLQLKISKDREAREKQRDADVKANEQRNLDFRKREVEVREQRERRLRKGAGKPIAPAGQRMVSQVEKVIDEQFPGLTKESRPLAVTELANRAQGLLNTTPGLTADEAAYRAIKGAKDDKEFQYNYGIGSWREWMPFAQPETRFQGGGRTSQSAVPLPAQPADRVVGKWYTNDAGQAAKWLGDGWEVAGPGEGEDEED